MKQYFYQNLEAIPIDLCKELIEIFNSPDLNGNTRYLIIKYIMKEEIVLLMILF